VRPAYWEPVNLYSPEESQSQTPGGRRIHSPPHAAGRRGGCFRNPELSQAPVEEGTGFTLLLVLLFLSPLASAGSLVRSLRPRVLEISVEGSVFLFPKIWRVVLEILVALEWILGGRGVLVYLVAPIVFAV